MVVVRSLNEIILSLIDYFKAAQPDLDTKPGTVARDLFIDAPAAQISTLYNEINKISVQQSLRLVSGSDLDKLAKNFGMARGSSTYASGVALLTFSSIPANIQISTQDTITSSNGLVFKPSNDAVVSAGSLNLYRSIATKYRNDLDMMGINDTYAIEVNVQATSPGISGNIAKYYLNSTSIYGVSNVTNILPFSGGSNIEDDSSFRARVLSIFGGSSIGTALGYRSAAIGVNGVVDAFIVEPGDPLMKRDGTVTSEDNNGNLTVLSEGTGGKVDVVVFGQNLTETNDSFIYQDKSNTNDPSDPKNNFILGQIPGDSSKTINRRRIDNIKSRILPSQPISDVFQVSGSISGSNFKEKSIDEYGRVSGNYEVVKDTGVYGGSPFGFDTFKWISNKISLYAEDKIKGKSLGKDPLTFPDVTAIPKLQQNILITNENSEIVASDRSLIKLNHTPAINVSRVFNVTTGERYTVVDQNYDPKDLTNKIGTIKISGNALPSYNDVLQVDYTWITEYDPFLDYDGKLRTNYKNNEDSVDWSYANVVSNERVKFIKNSGGNLFIGKTTMPINSVTSTIYCLEIDSIVKKITDGIFSGRLSVTVRDAAIAATAINGSISVDSVKLKNTSTEVFNTAQKDGLFTDSSLLIGSGFNFSSVDEVIIVLPTDSLATDGDFVTVKMNNEDVFTKSGITGSVSGNEVTIPSSNFSAPFDEVNLYVSYVAESTDVLFGSINSIPASKSGNSLISNSPIAYEDKYKSNIIKKYHSTVKKDIFNDFKIYLPINPTEFSIQESDIISVIRMSDMVELWSYENKGTIEVDAANSLFRIKLSTANAPQDNDKVFVIYYANSLKNIQPVVFSNSIIAKSLNKVYSGGNYFYVNCHQFIDDVVNFEVFDVNQNYTYFSGYSVDLRVYVDEDKIKRDNVANITIKHGNINQPLFDLSSASFGGKKIRITGSSKTNNNGVYDIIDYSYDATSSSITIRISNIISQITNSQVSITRIVDGKELWSSDGIIDSKMNRLIFPATQSIAVLDDVFVLFYEHQAIKKTPSRLSIVTSDQVANPGTLSIRGTSIIKVSDAIFSPRAVNGNIFRQDLSYILKDALGISSEKDIPQNVKIVNIAKLERVTLVGTSINEVMSVNGTYDIWGTKLKENAIYTDMYSQYNTQDLSYHEFILPQTSNNIANINADEKMRITFYYAIENDIENVHMQGNGAYYTNKRFAFIDSVYPSSGFRSSRSTKISISPFSQPPSGTRYKAYYDYIAPKNNERITIKYYFNKLISDVSLAIENNRTINSDILVREAKPVPIDVTLSVIVSGAYSNSSISVLQNVKDSLLSVINSNELGATIEYSAIINAAFSVSGVASAKVIIFNKSGNVGQKISIKAKSDEYFVANNIVVNREYR